MKVEFIALVKEVKDKALVSGDKSYRAMLETHDAGIKGLMDAPADAMVTVTVEWGLASDSEEEKT